MLTDAYGLYYNNDLLSQGRHHRAAQDPRRAHRRGREADRVQRRRQHQGGRVHAAARLLQRQHREHSTATATTPSGTTSPAKPSLATDPNWAKMLPVAEGLGRRDRLRQAAEVRRQARRGRLRVVGPARLRAGKIAMMIDGEWRNAFIAADKSKVNYATAPLPADRRPPDLYGSGQVGGTIIGIPKGVKHAAESWLLVKYMTTDIGGLTNLADGPQERPLDHRVACSTGAGLRPALQDLHGHLQAPQVDLQDAHPDRLSRRGPVRQPSARSGRPARSPTSRAGLEQLDTQIAKQLQLG